MTHRALHLSDLHRGANESPETDGALARLVAELEPVVVIVTGDLANRGRAAELRRARALLDGLGAPWLAVPGNHDLLPDRGALGELEAPYKTIGEENWALADSLSGKGSTNRHALYRRFAEGCASRGRGI